MVLPVPAEAFEFTAEFQLDGNGHSISGLICSTKASTEEEGNTGAYVGLIGLLADNALIVSFDVCFES